MADRLERTTIRAMAMTPTTIPTTIRPMVVPEMVAEEGTFRVDRPVWAHWAGKSLQMRPDEIWLPAAKSSKRVYWLVAMWST